SGTIDIQARNALNNVVLNMGVMSTLSVPWRMIRVLGVLATSQLDPGGFAPADPPRLRSRGPTIPAPLRRARLWRAWPVMRLAHNEYKILAASRITGSV